MKIEVGYSYSPMNKKVSKKDAIHIAVLLVKAHRAYKSGETVRIIRDGEGYITSDDETIPNLGVVDPFLVGGVKAGSCFYVFIYPNSVMNMAHTWDHPQLMDIQAAKARFEEHAKNLEVSYEDLLIAADRANRWDEYVTQIDSESQRDYMFSIDLTQFWLDYSALTGRKVDDFEHYVYSCSC